MSEERDIFNESVKGHLDNLEISYNENHWKEMEQKLDQMSPSDFGNPGSNVKYFVAAGIGVALIAGFFLINNGSETEESVKPVVQKEEMVNESTGGALKVEEPSADQNSHESKDISKPVIEKEVVQVEKAKEESGADHRADRYASLSEDQIKTKAKNKVDDLVKAQKKEFKNVPNIDNVALKSGIVISSKGPFCVGEAVTFTLEPTHENVTYSWNFGDKGLTSRKQSPNHVFKHAGTFDIIAFVSRGEKNDYKAVGRITIETNPEVEINWSNQEITLNDPYLKVSAKSNTQCEFAWTFNENVHEAGKDVSFLIPKKQIYAVKVVARSVSGCSTALTRSYNASKGSHIYVETEFKPNNGMGVEEFIPRELAISDVEFTFIVRDKTGNQVFESRDKYKGWNGRLNNNGSLLPAGGYYWVLNFKDDRGRIHNQDGKINLIN